MKKKKGGTKSRTRKSPRRRRISGVGSAVISVPVQMIFAVGGAVASKALNGVAKEVKFLKNSKYALPALKGVAAYYMLTSKQQYLQDAGIGVAAEAGLQLLEAVAPKVFKPNADSLLGIGASSTKYLDLDDMQINRGVGAYGEEVGVGAYGDEFEMAGVQ
jgi:hypothetical protein